MSSNVDLPSGPSPATTLRARLAALWDPKYRSHVELALTVVAVASLVLLFEPFLLKAVSNAADPNFFNDDARIYIFPFDHVRDPQLFADDYLGRYIVSCLPVGYRALFWTYSHFADPRGLSKVLPFVLFAVLLGALVVAATKFGHVAAAWVTAALCLSSGIFFGRMAGGIPRTFAYPIVACAAAALVHGRMTALAVITVIGAAFYPVAGVPAGIALAAVLLLLPAADRGTASSWSLRRRLVVLVATVLAAGAVLAPMMLAPREYGGYIREADIKAYPEAGPGGRYGQEDRPPYGSLVTAVGKTAIPALSGGGEPWTDVLEDPAAGPKSRQRNREVVIYVLLGVALAGFARLAIKDGAARRLATLLAAAIAGFFIAKAIPPFFYLPPRYIVYPLPVLVMIMIPAAAYGFFAGWERMDKPLYRGLAVFAFGLGALLLIGGRGEPKVGLDVRISPKAGLYQFVSTLPQDALVAGWPSAMDNVPYVTHRRAFVTFETHQAFQKGYVDTLRRRMHALIDAYFAADEAALVALRDDFGVTHLVVDKRHFKKPPGYFRPFGGWTKAAFKANAGNFEIPRLMKTAGVFEQGAQVVLDLRKLPGPGRRKKPARTDGPGSHGDAPPAPPPDGEHEVGHPLPVR
jgi:hypothetical protein